MRAPVAHQGPVAALQSLLMGARGGIPPALVPCRQGQVHNMPLPSPRAHLPHGDPRAYHPPPYMPGGPGVMFSAEDLDMVLYGYARTRPGDSPQGHALSGLRIGELSYGK